MNKIKNEHAPMYALICDDSKYLKSIKFKKKPQPLICGIFASEAEAVVLAEEMKGCACDHYIREVMVAIQWKNGAPLRKIKYAKQRQIKRGEATRTKPKSR